MKKVIFTCLVMIGATAAFAQFQQGRMLVGGSVGLSSTTQKNKSGSTTVTVGNTTEFSLQPQFGYFVIDHLAVGAGLDLSLSKFNPDEDDSDYERTETSAQFQPFVRYYLDPGVFFQGQFGVGSRKIKETNGNLSDTDKVNLTSWNLAVGYAIFLNDFVAIEPLIGYGSLIYKDPDADNDAKTKFNSLNLRVGFQIYLGK